jgi:hypothetical protein
MIAPKKFTKKYCDVYRIDPRCPDYPSLIKRCRNIREATSLAIRTADKRGGTIKVIDFNNQRHGHWLIKRIFSRFSSPKWWIEDQDM